jgi:hypothetical protein
MTTVLNHSYVETQNMQKYLQKAYNVGHVYYMTGPISYIHRQGSSKKARAFETSATIYQ